jgi:hypothetical protein
MRLIDADALKSKVQAQEWKRDPAVMLALDWIYMLINEQPTIDAVPVVRCKECRHYDTTGFPALNPGTGWCNKMGKGIHDDFYCFYGERKESEGST